MVKQNYLRLSTLHHANVLLSFFTDGKFLQKSDFVIALGSTDLRVARCAAELYKGRFAWNYMISGGRGRNTLNDAETEAVRYKAEFLKELDDLSDLSIFEDHSSNTKENFVETKKIYESLGLKFSSGIAVTQPHATIRVLATAKIQWPNISWSVWAPETTLDNYIDRKGSIELVVSELLGEVDRIMKYGAVGDMKRISIPDKVIASCEQLEQLGYSSNIDDRCR